MKRFFAQEYNMRPSEYEGMDFDEAELLYMLAVEIHAGQQQESDTNAAIADAKRKWSKT